MGKVKNSNDIFKIIGQNIRKARLLKGFSQENLAQDLDKSLNFISLLENGKTGLSVPTLIDICKVLDVSADSLFEGILSINYDDDQFIINTMHSLEAKDKQAISYLIDYIVESKTK